MTSIYHDLHLDDDQRRALLFQGHLFLYAPTAGSRAFCAFARELAAEAFAPHAPEAAQFHLPVERYVEILADLKPRFIHHSRSKELIADLLGELGCDPTLTFFDVPRLRTMAHGDYLSAGLAYAFHPHRDTWFSAPPCQINWWIPLHDLRHDNTLALHPAYWDRPLRNSSRDYNYYRWNKESRRAAASQITSDTRRQPQAEVPIDPEPELRVVCPAGGIVLFSAAQLHSTVRNTSGMTRFSIDFRTVHAEDVRRRRGAPNTDSACTGTTLRDFMQARDRSRLPDDWIAPYDDGSSTEGELIFAPAESSTTTGARP
jgi:hypothetical protein